MPHLKIHGVVASRAMRVLWLAEELGLAYQNIPVSFIGGATRSPEHLALNPNGHIPVIEDGGLVLWESMAINLYLARKHGGPLAPQSLAEEGLMMQWSFWVMTEVERAALTNLIQTRFMSADKRDHAALEAALSSLEAPLSVLDAALAKGHGHLVGERFTVADLNVAAVLSWINGAALLETRPHVKSWLAACLARPAFKSVMAARKKQG